MKSIVPEIKASRHLFSPRTRATNIDRSAITIETDSPTMSKSPRMSVAACDGRYLQNRNIHANTISKANEDAPTQSLENGDEFVEYIGVLGERLLRVPWLPTLACDVERAHA